MSDKGYLFDNASPETRGRFSGLERALDPTTFRHLSALGVGPGWACLEIGAGGGSVVRWLSDRVGPSGRVVATDVRLEWIDVGDAHNVEVVRHDIVSGSIPEATYDLVHARLVFLHLAARDEVFPKLVKALRPGGWLVVEEFTQVLPRVPEPRSPAEQCVNRVMEAVVDLLHAHGANTVSYPRTLVHRLRDLGLVSVGAEGAVVFGGEGVLDVHRANLRQVRDELIQTGRAASGDVDLALQTLDDPTLVATLSMLLSAWGQRG